ncbi:MAG: ABC transporter ATP-binding protein [Actinomycetota bacterium]
MSLQISLVSKSFHSRRGTQQVLRGVDLKIEKGEFVTFIGHSGCGKSTLLNVVGGLVEPDLGVVLVDGVPIEGPGPDRAMVFQHYSLLPWMTVYDNVREAARSARPERSKPETDEVVKRYLSAVGLWQHRSKKPGQISGGMQQRAAVARAFAVSPKVLLLDEPFGALDALTRARLQDQLVELWSGESATETVLMVTHGLDEAIFLADRIVVMAEAPHPSIADIIEVRIRRPRSKATIIHDPEYQRVHDRLAHLLMHQLAPASESA